MKLHRDFVCIIDEIFDNKEKKLFLESLNKPSPVSIRVNPFKEDRNKLFVNKDIVEFNVPWSSNGIYLKHNPQFTFDPLFHSGYYYVQEASSMFIEYIIKELIDSPICCLDLCASPGGKSISMLSSMPKNSFLISNEINRVRANILTENLIKFGLSNIIVTNNKPEDFKPLYNYFDLILVDAPCSGEGMFRKEEKAISEWSISNVNICVSRQRKILSDIWDSLKPDGILIYSTCTYNTLENEDNVNWICNNLGAEYIKLKIPDSWNISTSKRKECHAYRFFPHKTDGEGLFISIIRKKTDNTKPHYKNTNIHKSNDFIKINNQHSSLLKNTETFSFIQKKELIYAIEKQFQYIYVHISKHLNPIYIGVNIGSLKGKDFIPSTSIALSTDFQKDQYPFANLSLDEAISYLKKDSSLIIKSNKGFVLLFYKKEPIGFVKNINNRSNNLYPSEWRIKSSYTPNNISNTFI